MAKCCLQIYSTIKGTKKGQVNRDIIVEYNWTESSKNPTYKTHKESYKLYYSQKYQTWFTSLRKCLSKNMTLPSFSSEKQLQDTLSFLNRQNSVPLNGMFVAYAKKASDCVFTLFLVLCHKLLDVIVKISLVEIVK